MRGNRKWEVMGEIGVNASLLLYQVSACLGKDRRSPSRQSVSVAFDAQGSTQVLLNQRKRDFDLQLPNQRKPLPRCQFRKPKGKKLETGGQLKSVK